MGAFTVEQIREAIDNLCFKGTCVEHMPWGNGHINDTFLLVFEGEEKQAVRYILQRMNKNIFTEPVKLMENIVGVTSYLRKIIIGNGGNPDRETLNVIPAKDGKTYYVDSMGEYWRGYTFVEDAACFDKVGGDYVLKSNNAVKAAYLSLMLETNITEDRVYDSTRASASFNVESDVVTVLQDAAYSVNGNSVDLYCETTFKNIGNTVVNVKNADISTAYDIIGAPIKKVFEDMMEAQNNG